MRFPTCAKQTTVSWRHHASARVSAIMPLEGSALPLVYEQGASPLRGRVAGSFRHVFDIVLRWAVLVVATSVCVFTQDRIVASPCTLSDNDPGTLPARARRALRLCGCGLRGSSAAVPLYCRILHGTCLGAISMTAPFSSISQIFSLSGS